MADVPRDRWRTRGDTDPPRVSPVGDDPEQTPVPTPAVNVARGKRVVRAATLPLLGLALLVAVVSIVIALLFFPEHLDPRLGFASAGGGAGLVAASVLIGGGFGAVRGVIGGVSGLPSSAAGFLFGATIGASAGLVASLVVIVAGVLVASLVVIVAGVVVLLFVS